MSNVGQALTHQMVAREAAKILLESNNVFTHINTDRKREFGEEVNGYKKGDTVKVMVPPVPVTYAGATFAGGGSAPQAKESYVDLTVDQRLHVPLTFTAKEKKLEITEFRERFLRPALTSLASMVNAVFLREMYYQTPYVVGAWGTVPGSRAPWRNAASMLDRFLAPEDSRYAHISVDANDALAEANASLFHTSDELRGEFSKNAIGMFAGLEFYKQLSLPVHSNGAGAGYLVDGASQVGSVLKVKTGTGDITKGSTITIAGVNAVHPITGEDLGIPARFVVADNVSSGASEIPIYPALVPNSTSQRGNVTAAPADNAAITIFGTAAEGKRQNLVFHRDAFASAFVPLPVLASCEGYTATVKGLSVRVMTFGDGKSDEEHTRIDVLFAKPVAVRPFHACRVTE